MKWSNALFAFIFFAFCIANAFAQDDVYYDPNKDPAYQSPPPATNQNNYDQQPQQESTDKRDGYETPADKYDSPDYTESYKKDGDTYITNNYYDDDDDDFWYTNRLRRYYTPNFGVGFYSYWFTPSFYFGYSSWNNPYYVSYNPWYSDPWWGWNRPRRIIAYDPFFDPYWSWNFGWNSCAYYNAWSNPWGICGYPSMYYGCGYGGWGGYGYYNGYNNGYWNGYNQGYNNGYYDSWYNTAYNNTYYYNGPRRHRSSMEQTNTASTTTPPKFSRELSGVQTPVKQGVNIHDAEIPREGIQKPFTPNKELTVAPGTASPKVSSTPSITSKPGVNGETGKVGVAKPNPNNNAGVQPVRPNVSGNENVIEGGKRVEPRSFQRYDAPSIAQPMPMEERRDVPPVQSPRYERNYEQAPETRFERNERREMEEQPREFQRPQRNVQPREFEQREQMEAPQRMERPRMQEQPRNIQPQRMEQPRMQEQPRQFNAPQQEMMRFEQPRSNMREAAPMQRNFSPSQGGGNMRRR